ncbi:hypothetical protein CcCBS67573_g03624 [Chytriomyces confervae]|uniref:HTH APSES-type domain-containing protein n=1 Tax=Chytriomyces confervae TaxID=246404 RepID=A0A507FFI6_9FUNG|nr:hypothetical protein CcCBS67573_g03624 [Chytriomyces confervae]
MQQEEGDDGPTSAVDADDVAVDADDVAVSLPLDQSESYPFAMLQSPSPSESQAPWRSNLDGSDSKKGDDNADWAMPKQSPESPLQIHLPFSSCFRQDSKLFSFPSISIPLALDGDPFAPTSDSTASASELTPPFASLSTSPSPSAHSFSASNTAIPLNITTPPTISVDTHVISPELSPSLVHIDPVDGLFLDPASAAAFASIHRPRNSSLIPTYPFSDSMSCISSEEEDDSDEDEVLFLDQTMRDVTDMDPAAEEDVTMDDSMCSDFGESLQATFGVTSRSAEYNTAYLDEPVSNVFESSDTFRNSEGDMSTANANQTNHLEYPEMFAMEDVANESSGSSSSISSYSESDAYESDSERKKRSAAKLSKLQKRALQLASASGDPLFSTKTNSQSKKIKLVLRRDAAKNDLAALSASLSDSVRQSSGVDLCRATPLSASAPGIRTRGKPTVSSMDGTTGNEPKPEKVMKKRGRRPGTTVVDGRVVLKSELHLMELGDLLLPPSPPPPPSMMPKPSRISSRRSSFKSTRKGSLKSSLPQLLETLHNSDLKSLVARETQSLTVGTSAVGSLSTAMDQPLFGNAQMKPEENSVPVDDSAASGESVAIDISDDVSTSSIFDESETQTNDSTHFEIDAELISGEHVANYSESFDANGAAPALAGSQLSEESATSSHAAILTSATIHSPTSFNPLRRSRSLKVGASKQKCSRKDSGISAANNLKKMDGAALSEGVAISAESVHQLDSLSPPGAGTLSTRAHSSSSSTGAPTATGTGISPHIALAMYSKVQVWEFHISGIGVMRRVSDGWFNCTHILRLAGFGEKSKRTKILERIVETGMAEKIQGGVGKYQGTWIPFERALKMAQEYGVAGKLAPLFEIPV